MHRLGVFFANVYNTLKSYTSETAQDVATFDGGDEVFQSAGQKIGLIMKNLKDGTPETISFSADELNTIISRASTDALKHHIFLNMGEGVIKAEFSIPIKVLSEPSYPFQDRFFNGVAQFQVSIRNLDPPATGTGIFLNFQEITLNNQVLLEDKKETMLSTISTAFIAAFNQQVNQGYQKDPRSAKFLQHLKALHVDGDQLVFEMN